MRSFTICTTQHIILVIKTRKMRWVWHVARLGAKRGAYRVLVGIPKGKRLVGRPRLG